MSLKASLEEMEELEKKERSRKEEEKVEDVMSRCSPARLLLELLLVSLYSIPLPNNIKWFIFYEIGIYFGECGTEQRWPVDSSLQVAQDHFSKRTLPCES